MRWCVTCIFVSNSVMLAGAVESPDASNDGAVKAQEFWRALAGGDVKTLRTFYAPRVTVKAGSELLKPRWELDPKADRKHDLTVERGKLLTGYERLISSAGREKWSKVFGGIAAERITTVSVMDDDKPFPGGRAGDILLTVATGPSDDTLIFLLRSNESKQWQVVAEATDY